MEASVAVSSSLLNLAGSVVQSREEEHGSESGIFSLRMVTCELLMDAGGWTD